MSQLADRPATQTRPASPWRAAGGMLAEALALAGQVMIGTAQLHEGTTRG
jgi:hypothetical protein